MFELLSETLAYHLLRMKYFSYGSNMDALQMQSRCPTARQLGTAVLSSHHFQIDGRGVATVTACTGFSVHGVVWDITEADEASLDRYEGVPNFYVKQCCLVRLDDTDATTLIYCSTNYSTGSPRSGYLEKIITAAEDNDLPGDYVMELKSWMGAQNS